MGNIIRTTISVAADLKRRMDKVKEPVNWSALACRAFEQKLGEIAAKKEKKTMDDVIQRLRASRQQFDDRDYSKGLEAGKEWAKSDAEAVELQRLAKLRETIDADARDSWQDWFETGGSRSAWGAWERFVFLIRPETDGDRSACGEFWEEVLGDDVHMAGGAAWLRGFADGALEIWWEVERQL